MSEAVTLRPAALNEAPAIAALHVAAWQETCIRPPSNPRVGPADLPKCREVLTAEPADRRAQEPVQRPASSTGSKAKEGSGAKLTSGRSTWAAAGAAGRRQRPSQAANRRGRKPADPVMPA
jgi:hypothetical protein